MDCGYCRGSTVRWSPLGPYSYLNQYDCLVKNKQFPSLEVQMCQIMTGLLCLFSLSFSYPLFNSNPHLFSLSRRTNTSLLCFSCSFNFCGLRWGKGAHSSKKWWRRRTQWGWREQVNNRHKNDICTYRHNWLKCSCVEHCGNQESHHMH